MKFLHLIGFNHIFKDPAMNTLPIELLEKILRYLPAKEATVYNLVSKTFYDVISRVLTCKNPLTIDVPKVIEEI